MSTPKPIDDVRRLPARAVPKPRPLPHLAPYVPPTPVTTITPSAWGPRRPAVADPTVHRIRPLPPPTPVPAATSRVQTPPRTVGKQPAPSQRPVPAISPKPAPAETRPVRAARVRRSGWRRLSEAVQYPLVAGLALVAANNTTLGQWFVLAYAIVALVRRIRSQVSFGAALFLLVAIPVFQLLHQPGIAQNIAIYVYELLVVGTLQAVVELYKTRHHKRGRV